MMKTIEPKPQRHGPPPGTKAYVRVAARLFYINSEAMKLFGDHETCSISIDVPGKVMVITPDGPWKLSPVKDTRNAKRIETRTAVNTFLEAGFPKGLLGKYLPCHPDMVGSLIVSLMVDYDMLKGA